MFVEMLNRMDEMRMNLIFEWFVEKEKSNKAINVVVLFLLCFVGWITMVKCKRCEK